SPADSLSVFVCCADGCFDPLPGCGAGFCAGRPTDWPCAVVGLTGLAVPPELELDAGGGDEGVGADSSAPEPQPARTTPAAATNPQTGLRAAVFIAATSVRWVSGPCAVVGRGMSSAHTRGSY